MTDPRPLTETDHPTGGRHPATQHLLRFFTYDHLPEGPIREMSADCSLFAFETVAQLPDGPELTTGLRKLLEAKDCFVRCAIAARDKA